MNTSLLQEQRGHSTSNPGLRARLLAGIPVTERTLMLAGTPTVVLEGGSGAPLVLLHGPGESAVKWLRVLPELVKTYRVIAPDLPAHGASGGGEEDMTFDHLLAWVGDLLAQTCPQPPVLLGHVIGGAIAARFAIAHGDRLSGLVLVDSLGLTSFRPAPRFALRMIHFLARPNERTYNRFMRQCSYDLDGLRRQMGHRWQPFVDYNLTAAQSPRSGTVGLLMRTFGLRRIPSEELARITVPTTLIWGRHDRATRLRRAEQASARHGWPLYVVENCADDPARDQPEAFLKALHQAISGAPVPESRPGATRRGSRQGGAHAG